MAGPWLFRTQQIPEVAGEGSRLRLAQRAGGGLRYRHLKTRSTFSNVCGGSGWGVSRVVCCPRALPVALAAHAEIGAGSRELPRTRRTPRQDVWDLSRHQTRDRRGGRAWRILSGLGALCLDRLFMPRGGRHSWRLGVVIVERKSAGGLV